MDPVCHRRTTLLAESSARFVQLRNSSVGRSLNVEQNSRPEHPSRHWSSTRNTSSNECLSTQHQAVTLQAPRYHQHVLNQCSRSWATYKHRKLQQPTTSDWRKTKLLTNPDEYFLKQEIPTATAITTLSGSFSCSRSGNKTDWNHEYSTIAFFYVTLELRINEDFSIISANMII